VSSDIAKLELQNNDELRIDFSTGEITNLRNSRKIMQRRFPKCRWKSTCREVYFNGSSDETDIRRKILGAPKGSIVFCKPDLVLSHDNTASIYNTFLKMEPVVFMLRNGS